MSVADRSPIAVLRALVTEIQEKQITFLAASLAYYAFASLIPLLLLAISIAALVGGRSLANRITEAAGGSLPESVSSILMNTVSNEGAAGASIGIGLVFLLWSAIKIFRGMDIAFSEVYGDPGPEGIVDQVTDALITLLGIVLAVVVTIVIGAVVSFVQQSAGVLSQVGLGFLEGIIGWLAGFLSIVGLCLAFYPLYYVLPTDDVTVREAVPGAIFAAIGWTVLQTGFRLYAAQSGSSAYGIIGAALLILTFLYFGGMIILIGVALNAVLAGRVGEGSEAEEGDGDEGEEAEPEGETNRDGGVFRSRVKERTQSIIDEREADRGDADASADGDGDRDRAITDGGRDASSSRGEAASGDDGDRLVTDGGVEAEPTEASETGPETGSAGTADSTASTDGPDATDATGIDATGSPEADPDTGPEAAAARGLDGREHTLSEEYALQREIERLRAELDAFEMEVEERVVDRDDLEGDLKEYVRSRVRSGKARGWGPYLVLLYGTAMTIAIALGDALSGGWAVAAILVIFLSTLGLYVLMVLVGLGLSALAIPGKLRNTVQSLRS